MDETHINIEFIETAEDFLSELDPLGNRFGGRKALPEQWYFRGSAYSSWDLLPSALRPGAMNVLGQWYKGPMGSNAEQIAAEAGQLAEFIRLADRSGLYLPENAFGLCEYLNRITLRREWPAVWPIDELIPILALAQHHRLPTRLLDWSRNAFIAAYFAAIKAASWNFKDYVQDKPADAAYLCVWAISTTVFEVPRIIGEPFRITPIDAPYASNAYKRSQKGLFLIDRPEKIDPSESVDVRPWDQLISEDWRWAESRERLLEKICLPIKEAPKLLHLLRFHGIDAATLFPDYGGAVSAIMERKFCDR